MAEEVELKLEISDDAAEALAAAPLFAGEPKRQSLRAIYFDTPARQLQNAGFSLRIRQSAGKRVQTIKATGAVNAGLFARPEWERAAEDDRPVLDDTTPLKALLGPDVLEVAPLFEVNVERLVRVLSWQGALIEVALDRGEVVAAERRSPICEIELELKEGPAQALFSLARQVDEIAPCRPGVLSKSERGYLLLGPAIRFVKAEPVALSPDMTAQDALRSIAGGCLRQFLLNEPLVSRNNPEALHQARVALRRLRSALSIFRDIAYDETAVHVRDEMRWLANVFGPARDLDVLIGQIDADDPAFEKLVEARERAYAQVEADLSSDRARKALLDLCEWLGAGQWLDDPAIVGAREAAIAGVATGALERLRRKVKKQGRKLETLPDDMRHEIRKDAKKLRYAVEFFEALYTGKKRVRRRARFLSALEALQERLGTLNDLAVAGETVASAGATDETVMQVVEKARRKRVKDLEAAAEAYEDFADAKPFWR